MSIRDLEQAQYDLDTFSITCEFLTVNQQASIPVTIPSILTVEEGLIVGQDSNILTAEESSREVVIGNADDAANTTVYGDLTVTGSTNIPVTIPDNLVVKDSLVVGNDTSDYSLYSQYDSTNGLYQVTLGDTTNPATVTMNASKIALNTSDLESTNSSFKATFSDTMIIDVPNNQVEIGTGTNVAALKVYDECEVTNHLILDSTYNTFDLTAPDFQSNPQESASMFIGYNDTNTPAFDNPCDVSIYGTLKLNGQDVISGDLNNLTVEQTLTVGDSSSSSYPQTLTVDATAGSQGVVIGTSTLNAPLTINGDLTVTGSSNIPVTIPSTLNVETALTVGDDDVTQAYMSADVDAVRVGGSSNTSIPLDCYGAVNMLSTTESFTIGSSTNPTFIVDQSSATVEVGNGTISYDLQVRDTMNVGNGAFAVTSTEIDIVGRTLVSNAGFQFGASSNTTAFSMNSDQLNMSYASGTNIRTTQMGDNATSPAFNDELRVYGKLYLNDTEISGGGNYPTDPEFNTITVDNTAAFFGANTNSGYLMPMLNNNSGINLFLDGSSRTTMAFYSDSTQKLFFNTDVVRMVSHNTSTPGRVLTLVDGPDDGDKNQLTAYATQGIASIKAVAGYNSTASLGYIIQDDGNYGIKLGKTNGDWYAQFSTVDISLTSERDFLISALSCDIQVNDIDMGDPSQSGGGIDLYLPSITFNSTLDNDSLISDAPTQTEFYLRTDTTGDLQAPSTDVVLRTANNNNINIQANANGAGGRVRLYARGINKEDLSTTAASLEVDEADVTCASDIVVDRYINTDNDVDGGNVIPASSWKRGALGTILIQQGYYFWPSGQNSTLTISPVEYTAMGVEIKIRFKMDLTNGNCIIQMKQFPDTDPSNSTYATKLDQNTSNQIDRSGNNEWDLIKLNSTSTKWGMFTAQFWVYDDIQDDDPHAIVGWSVYNDYDTSGCNTWRGAYGVTNAAGYQLSRLELSLANTNHTGIEIWYRVDALGTNNPNQPF